MTDLGPMQPDYRRRMEALDHLETLAEAADNAAVGQTMMRPQAMTDFHTHCPPSTVIALIQNIRGLEGEVARYGEPLNEVYETDGVDIVMRNMRDLRARAEAAEQRVKELEARTDHGDCTCLPPPITEGPEEDCPQHGRDYSWWVGCAKAKVEQLLAAEAREQALRDRVSELADAIRQWESSEQPYRHTDHVIHAACVLVSEIKCEHDWDGSYTPGDWHGNEVYIETCTKCGANS